VSNASAVSINDIGTVAPQGSRTVNPDKTTTYVLTANGSTMLAEQTVEVHEPKPQQQPAVSQPAVASAPRPASGPERGTLEQALGAYKSVFARASGKSKKDCQAAFGGAFSGKLNAWSNWCEEAKSFDLSEQCSQVGGSPDAPTLTCAEALTVRLKDGDPQQTHAQRTFRFTKGPDGNWQVTGW
jgi:hypothetical protein